MNHTQLMILIIGDSNDASLKHYQNLIVTDNHDDVRALIENTRFDLIFFDLGLDYSKFNTQIKSSDNLNRKTPVFAIASSAKTINQDELSHFAGWITKPITVEQINEISESWQAKAARYIQIVQSRTNNNRHLALIIFEKLFDELPEQIARIKAGLDDKQYGLAREIAHQLNGSASFCGLTDIQQAANALEHCLLNNDLITLDRHFHTLEHYSLDLIRREKLILANLGKC